MKSLYLRIWLTVVAALALFALVSGWMWQRHLDDELAQFEQTMSDRLMAWVELVQRSLPAAEAPRLLQAEALRDWSARLHVPLALDDASGRRIGESDSYQRRVAQGGPSGVTSVLLDDGRTLWLARRGFKRVGQDGPPPNPWMLWRPRSSAGTDSRAPALGEGRPSMFGGLGGGGRGPLFGRDEAPPRSDGWLPIWPVNLPRAVGPLVLVALLFVAVAAGAYPVVRRLTRRLEALKQGVAAFGRGELGLRVDDSGRDEVAAVAATFNRTAERIETLVRSHQRLLANASHELRSPLARLKMAVAMLVELPPERRVELLKEINTNIAELDALVEEVLLASRLEGGAPVDRQELVDLLGVAAEEAARVGASVAGSGESQRWAVHGNERLLRRALRNLLENAHRYGGDEVEVDVLGRAGAPVQVRVSDRGPGVPAEYRERIFEPYVRLPGHAEREGGVGLGLSLVKQIAAAHGGSVRCEPREGGGSAFVLSLPAG